MSVEAKIAVPEASSPSHPEHARWVKERTLAIEVEHARAIGGSLRGAETANMRNLERLAAKARETKPAPAVTKPSTPEYREPTHEELAAGGVRKRAYKPVGIISQTCGYCGHCLACKRLTRVGLIARKLKAGDADARLRKLQNALSVMTLAWGLQRTFRDCGVDFDLGHPVLAQRLRALDAATDQILDRSVAILGGWR